MARRAGLLERVDAEIAAGRPWRAKELMRGSIPAHTTDVELLERYGLLLDSLGDRVEAGKYLFLSGRRGPRHDEAIALFLHRHGRGDVNDLLAQLPARARRAGVDAFPPAVRLALVERGLPPGQTALDEPVDTPRPLRRRAANALGCLFWLIIAVATPVGLLTIARWLRAQL
jgi:hypothetical protein